MNFLFLSAIFYFTNRGSDGWRKTVTKGYFQQLFSRGLGKSWRKRAGALPVKLMLLPEPLPSLGPFPSDWGGSP